jgi:5-methylcytosine-specific restriction endonuclease McrA
MALRLATENLFDEYSNLLRREKIPPTQLEATHLNTFMLFSHTDNYALPQPNDLDILKINGFFKTVCTFIIEANALDNYKMIDDKTDIIALSIEHTTLTLNMVKALCNMVNKPRYSWWLKERIQEILNNNEAFKETFEKIALENSIDIPQMFR